MLESTKIQRRFVVVSAIAILAVALIQGYSESDAENTSMTTTSSGPTGPVSIELASIEKSLQRQSGLSVRIDESPKDDVKPPNKLLAGTASTSDGTEARFEFVSTPPGKVPTEGDMPLFGFSDEIQQQKRVPFDIPPYRGTVGNIAFAAYMTSFQGGKPPGDIQFNPDTKDIFIALDNALRDSFPAGDPYVHAVLTQPQ